MIKIKNIISMAVSSIMLASSFAVIMGMTGGNTEVASAETYVGNATAVNNITSNVKQQTISDFMREGQSIIYQTELNDFEGNKFMLYELTPAGYAIYGIKGEASIFLEGSLSSNSPFYEYLDKDIIYLGFGEYYYKQGAEYINIMTEESYMQDELPQECYLDESAYYETAESESVDEPQASPLGMILPEGYDSDNYVEVDGFTCIADYEYFQNLSKFPDNEVGTCSLVAICIILGYMDEYIDDRFIPDNMYYDGLSFKDGDGTSQGLHNYLFDNCLHTLAGFGDDENGYPMANGEINNTVKEYLKIKCGRAFESDIKYMNGIINTKKNPRKYIKAGYPTILTMTEYKIINNDNYDDMKRKYHSVVAYGYNEEDDTFLVHIGWDPGSTDGAQVIVSEAYIYSYNAFIYMG